MILGSVVSFAKFHMKKVALRDLPSRTTPLRSLHPKNSSLFSRPLLNFLVWALVHIRLAPTELTVKALLITINLPFSVSVVDSMPNAAWPATHCTGKLQTHSARPMAHRSFREGSHAIATPPKSISYIAPVVYITLFIGVRRAFLWCHTWEFRSPWLNATRSCRVLQYDVVIWRTCVTLSHRPTPLLICPYRYSWWFRPPFLLFVFQTFFLTLQWFSSYLLSFFAVTLRAHLGHTYTVTFLSDTSLLLDHRDSTFVVHHANISPADM